MAKPIKETPVLFDKDARIFLAAQKKNEDKRVDEKTRQQIKSNYDKLKSIAEF